MQFEHIKKRIILDFIEEIVSMEATDLELVGNFALELINKQRLIHRGVNEMLRPVGYTVDTYSQEGDVVGEYSTDEKYFKDSAKKGDPIKFEKIENDIKHALSHGTPKKIFLITSQKEPEHFRSKFLSTEIGKTYARLVDIIDARQLANYIYDFSIANAASAAFFGRFFPTFYQHIQNYEYYGRVPGTCETYQPEEAILNVISEHYAAKYKICVLYGLSGSGKTQATIDYVHREINNFEDCIWISGEDWKKDTTLSAVQRARGGFPFNVAGAFNSRKSILVIDSLERTADPTAFSELDAGFALGGVVLVTSQLGSPGNPLYVLTPPLSRNTASIILGEKLEDCSIFASQFINLCRFSPLILATTRNIARLSDISKEDLYCEVLDNPDALSQEDGTSIMRSLLKRLEPNNLAALVKIADSGSTTHDIHFLAHFIGQIERVNLQRLAILQVCAAPGVLKVHDLICEAVKQSPDSLTIADSIETYVSKLDGEMLPSVLRQIHLCSERLYKADEYRMVRKPDWLLYSILQVNRKVNSCWSDLYNYQINGNSTRAELLCIIDAKEAYAYTIEDKDVRQQYYKDCASIYQQILNLGIDNIMKAELLHHQGKALRRCGMYEPSLKCFLEVLTLRHNWHATYGQIAHLGSQNGATRQMKSEGEKAIQWLINQMLENVSSIPLRVSLAAISRMRSYRAVSNEISTNPNHVTQIAEIIAMSALEGLDQFYEAFLSFTSVFGYHHSTACVALAEAVPEILAMPPEAVDKKQWPSACEALVNTAIAAGRLDREDLKKHINQSATIFVTALDTPHDVGPYISRVIAKTYISVGMPQNALARIEKVQPDKIDHWLLYQKSRAQSELEMFQPAFHSALNALEYAKKDSKVLDRLAIYFDQLSKCAEQIHDLPLAISYSHEAVKYCNDEQYLRDLCSRHQLLEELQKQ